MLLHSSKVHKTKQTKYKLCSTIYLSFFVVLKKVFLERCTYTNTHFNLLPPKKKLDVHFCTLLCICSPPIINQPLSMKLVVLCISQREIFHQKWVEQQKIYILLCLEMNYDIVS